MNKLLLSAGLILSNIQAQPDTTPSGTEFSRDCPCFGNAFDILGACGNEVRNQDDIGCFAADFGILIGRIAFLNCFDVTAPEGPLGGQLLNALTSPLFGVVEVFGLGVCVNSPNGLLGLIGELFEEIFGDIDEFGDCFEDDRRRLGSGGDKFHGSVLALEGFVELLECKSKKECLDILFKDGGIVQLVQKMRAIKNGGSRRLLSDEEDEFSICDFSFFAGFLLDPLGGDFGDAPFEALLAGIFESADCDGPGVDFLDSIVCEIIDAVGPFPGLRRRSRRLLSESREGDDDDDEDGDEFSIIFGLDPLEEFVCAANIAAAENCLNEFAEDGCFPGILGSTPQPQ